MYYKLVDYKYIYIYINIYSYQFCSSGQPLKDLNYALCDELTRKDKALPLDFL